MFHRRRTRLIVHAGVLPACILLACWSGLTPARVQAQTIYTPPPPPPPVHIPSPPVHIPSPPVHIPMPPTGVHAPQQLHHNLYQQQQVMHNLHQQQQLHLNHVQQQQHLNSQLQFQNHQQQINSSRLQDAKIGQQVMSSMHNTAPVSHSSGVSSGPANAALTNQLYLQQVQQAQAVQQSILLANQYRAAQLQYLQMQKLRAMQLNAWRAQMLRQMMIKKAMGY